MNNTLKQLADLVRQERHATMAFEQAQDKIIARQQKDNARLSVLKDRVGEIAARKHALLDILTEDDFEAVTVK